MSFWKNIWPWYTSRTKGKPAPSIFKQSNLKRTPTVDGPYPFAPHGNHGTPLFVGIYRGNHPKPGSPRWCAMDFGSIGQTNKRGYGGSGDRGGFLISNLVRVHLGGILSYPWFPRLCSQPAAQWRPGGTVGNHNISPKNK